MKRIEIFIPTTEDLERNIAHLKSYLFSLSYSLEDRLFNGGKLVWKTMYKLTGRCGSRSMSHWPMISNPHTWLWISTEEGLKKTFHCTICGENKVSFMTREVLDDRTDEMIEEGKKHAIDMVQPYRQGELSREFVELYPDKVKKMIKDGAVTSKEVKNSRDVWRKDLKGLDKVTESGIVDHIAKE